MRQIWKYPLQPGATASIPGDADHPVTLVAPDPGNQAPVAVWIEHRLEPSPEPNVSFRPVGLNYRTFQVVGTGWDIQPDWTHVGSCVSGDEVWHVYEWRP